MLPDETCNFLVFDFDNHDDTTNGDDYANTDELWREEVNALREICRIYGVDILTERSRSGKGAHILGFSDGGNIALVFALKYPERVDHLILNGANLNASGVKPSIQIPIVLGYLTARALTGLGELPFLKKRGSSFYKKARRNMEMLGLMVNDPNIRPEELVENKEPDFVRIKKLVIAGNKDMIKDEHTRLIYASLPNAQIRILRGTHFIAKENYIEFNHAVEKFLKNC